MSIDIKDAGKLVTEKVWTPTPPIPRRNMSSDSEVNKPLYNMEVGSRHYEVMEVQHYLSLLALSLR